MKERATNDIEKELKKKHKKLVAQYAMVHFDTGLGLSITNSLIRKISSAAPDREEIDMLTSEQKRKAIQKRIAATGAAVVMDLVLLAVYVKKYRDI